VDREPREMLGKRVRGEAKKRVKKGKAVGHGKSVPERQKGGETLFQRRSLWRAGKHKKSPFQKRELKKGNGIGGKYKKNDAGGSLKVDPQKKFKGEGRIQEGVRV